jgi:dihydrolipoamide dehydrogenase
LSDDLFELPELPASIAIVGTGIVGLELGQALHRLGVRTTCFSHSPGLAQLSDPAVQAVAAEVLGRELDLQITAELAFEREAEAWVARWRDGTGQARAARFAAVLCAAGRHPNLAGLDLARAGVPAIPVVDSRTMQCGALPIFFAGDVAADRPVLHEATDEGTIAGINAANFPDVRAHLRRTPLLITFTAPNIAVVGTPFGALDAEQIEVGSVSYADQGRARVMGENEGLVRIYARRGCGTLIGAEMFGPRVEHTAHLLAWAVQRRLTVEETLSMPVYHPVIEEGIRAALRDLCARLGLRPPAQRRGLEYGPGA